MTTEHIKKIHIHYIIKKNNNRGEKKKLQALYRQVPPPSTIRIFFLTLLCGFFLHTLKITSYLKCSISLNKPSSSVWEKPKIGKQRVQSTTFERTKKHKVKKKEANTLQSKKIIKFSITLLYYSKVMHCCLNE